MPTVPSIGNWTSDQISPMTNNTHFDCTRLTMKPVTTAEIENSRKKLDPTRPNCFGVRLSSVMIGTPANPIMALSAKLIIMNRNSRATITHAPFSGRTSVMAFPSVLRPRLASFL